MFVVGLDIGLFPLGETLAEEFARKGSLSWLLVFSFLLGAGTTVAEPALIAITDEGALVPAEAGRIPDTHASISGYALGTEDANTRKKPYRRLKTPPPQQAKYPRQDNLPAVPRPLFLPAGWPIP